MLCVCALILCTILSCIAQCIVMYFIVLCFIVLCCSGNTVDSCSMYLCTVIFFRSTLCCKYCKACYIENNVVCLVVVILTVLCPTKI